VQTSRALGIFALSAVILAAISFAAVDAIIAAAGRGTPLPAVALACAVTGTVALVASVPPAIIWLAAAIRRAHHEAESHTDSRPFAVVRPVYEDDEL
jgi:hypothetical protein